MFDLSTISVALSSLKTATDIAKFLRESNVSLEHAELKLKLADLLGALADVKLEVIEVQETLISKEKRIAELEEAFHNNNLLVRQYDAYYAAAENGRPAGVPYCLRCWENDHRKRQLVHDAKNWRIRTCTSCGHQYEARLAPELPAAEGAGQRGGTE